jgi:hypothetical protein
MAQRIARRIERTFAGIPRFPNRAAPLVFCCLLLAACTEIVFQPMRPLLRTPDEIGLDYEDVYFESHDGTRLHGWFLSAEGAAKGTVLQLHGNAENISTHIGSVYWLPARGFNVMLLDYRGYGLSGGEPSLAGAVEDVESAVEWLLRQKQSDRRHVVVLGQSLGGALGAYAIATSGLSSQICALILDSTFGDYRDVAREKFGEIWFTWLFQYPLSWTIDDYYAPIRVISRISPTPILVIHSIQDPIIPAHHAHRMFDAAGQPKELWIVPDGLHISALSKPEIRDRLVAYLTNVLYKAP